MWTGHTSRFHITNFGATLWRRDICQFCYQMLLILNRKKYVQSQIIQGFCFFPFLFNLQCTTLFSHDGQLCGVQTLNRYPCGNWLRGLCHPLHLSHKSDTVMNGASSDGSKFLVTIGNWTGTLRTRVKDLDHRATLLLWPSNPDFFSRMSTNTFHRYSFKTLYLHFWWKMTFCIQ